jgi:hypothetical protein
MPYFEENRNFYNPTVIKTRMIFHRTAKILFPKDRSEGTLQVQLKKDITGLLSSGGGVLLFGCESQSEQIIARGINLKKWMQK